MTTNLPRRLPLHLLQHASAFFHCCQLWAETTRQSLMSRVKATAIDGKLVTKTKSYSHSLCFRSLNLLAQRLFMVALLVSPLPHFVMWTKLISVKQ